MTYSDHTHNLTRRTIWFLCTVSCPHQGVCQDLVPLVHKDSRQGCEVGVVGHVTGIEANWMKACDIRHLLVVPPPSRLSTVFWLSVKYGCLGLLCAAMFWCGGRLLRSASNRGFLLNPFPRSSFSLTQWRSTWCCCPLRSSITRKLTPDLHFHNHCKATTLLWLGYHSYMY